MMPRGVTVAAVQMRFRPTVDGNVERITGAIEAAAGDGADFILFPECAVTGYHREFHRISRGAIEAALEAIAAAARTARCHVLVGSPTFAGGRRHNSLVAFNRRGREVFRYHKIHLTVRDRRFFSAGNHPALFRLDRVPCTAFICHERRFPELVRLPVMLGARIAFHPNAGLDTLAVSRAKRGGRDGMAARALENDIFYVFANSVGPQGGGLWSAGDSKIVAPDGALLALAGHRDETILQCHLNLEQAGRRHALEALHAPAFLRPHWRSMLKACRRQLALGRRGANG